jgi:TolA-binding protein
MKTFRWLFLFSILALLPGFLKAQKTVYYQSVNRDLQDAKELYSAQNYISAMDRFKQIADQSDINSDLKTEALFYKVMCSLKLDNRNAEEEVTVYLKQFPESSFRNRILFEEAIYQFDNKKYAAALKALEEINKNALSDEERAHFYYMRGYAAFEKEKYNDALTDFSEIKDGNSLYAAPAGYYFGHINYLNGNYDVALQEFLKLQKNPVFEKVIPFYISQIYYKQSKYRELVDYTAPIINHVSADQQPELARLLGNSYFHLRDFKNATQFLEFYLSDKKNKGREENYMLGYCYYLGNESAKAIIYLETASKGNDELAQNAYYHLAECYVETNDKNKARQAFEAASELDFDAKIKEDALFNYAKITYELSYSPFNETIKAFDKYISLYPNSERNDVAYDYLVKVYMSTSNFREAMASIEKIKVKSPSVNKAYQRVAYYRALECFNNLDYKGSVENFDKSIEAGSFNKSYQALALFWKAEALFRLGNYNKSITEYSSFLKSSGILALQEYKTAHYNLAYAYFQVKDYASASDYFRKYLNLEDDPRSEKVADANNRLGDCNFLNRDYSQAIANYDKALSMNVYDADYSLFQKGFCMGLQRDNQGKINALNTLIKNYPNSSYQADALYELGRTYERTNQPQLAINFYKELISKYPQSNLLNKALVQLGLVSYNANDFQGSIKYYKQVVERTPNTQDAQAALAGMKNSYVELNDVDSYFAYANKLGSGAQVSVDEQDSLSYQSSEKLYMANDTKARAQFEKYLSQFPQGSFALNAHFYLAQLLYNEGEFDKALAEYEQVIAKPDNDFTEVALLKAAGLYYNDGNYKQSLVYFDQMAKLSTAGKNMPDALTGIMRCQFKLNNYPACIDAASQILALEKVSDILKRETTYKLAVSYYNSGNTDKAYPLLTKLSTDTNSAEGAEAKYLVAQILYDKQKLKESEKEIMDFIDKNSPHQFWLAKSFLLLSDIYLKSGDEFQAKHTLKSVVENYPDKDDGIIELTNKKLQQIETAEATQTKNQSKPLEINITGKKK